MGTITTIPARTHIGDISIAWDMDNMPRALIVSDEGIISIDLVQLVYNEVKKGGYR